MNNAMNEATEKLVDDIADAVRRERERENALTPDEEKLRLRYTSALRSMNRLTEREAGQLLQPAAQPGF
ncbi:MAG: hypothetical protein INF52_04765 [Rhodobacter sp.]|nr:hypothetical protein [Rhodobacter sp.]